MKATVSFFGPTGNAGPHAVREQARRGSVVRAFALPDDDTVDRLPSDAEVVRGDLADPDSVERALDGVDGVPLMWPFFTGFCANPLVGRPQVRSGNTLRLPQGAAARSSVEEADLGEVAAAVLTEDCHAGRRYLVTGPAAFSQKNTSRRSRSRSDARRTGGMLSMRRRADR